MTKASPRRSVQPVPTGHTSVCYRSWFRTFDRWCNSVVLCSLPATPATVVSWIASATSGERPFSLATARSYLSAIRRAHDDAGHPSPTHHAMVYRALQLREGEPPPARPSVSSKDVRAVLPEIDPFSANDTRNRALVLLAYAGSLQSAELIGLHIGDLTFRPRGLVVDVAGDQVVIRSSRHIEADPITAVRAWVRLLRTRHRDTSAVDPLFRRVDPHDNVGKEPLSKTSPNGVVKRLTPALTCAVLARGLIAEAKNLGVPPEALERHTRRQGELDERFEDALVHKVGL